MSEALGTAGTIPVLQLDDRMLISLRHAGLTSGEMAEYLGVNRGTITRWFNGQTQPSVQSLRLWALRCGVSYAWLKDGDAAGPDGPGGGKRARRDSNPQPSDLEPTRLPNRHNVLELRPAS